VVEVLSSPQAARSSAAPKERVEVLRDGRILGICPSRRRAVRPRHCRTGPIFARAKFSRRRPAVRDAHVAARAARIRWWAIASGGGTLRPSG
jgi:hypothetical protein